MLKSIDRIAIFGAGAMGAAYAGLFTDNSDIRVCFAARGDRFARLDGATINVNAGIVDSSGASHRVDCPFDLVLVALKHHHLTEPVLKDINALKTVPDTLILSVMNGLESEKVCSVMVYGHEKIVFCHCRRY